MIVRFYRGQHVYIKDGYTDWRSDALATKRLFTIGKAEEIDDFDRMNGIVKSGVLSDGTDCTLVEIAGLNLSIMVPDEFLLTSPDPNWSNAK